MRIKRNGILLAILLFFSLTFLNSFKTYAVTQDALNNFKIRVYYTSSSVSFRLSSYYSIYIDGNKANCTVIDNQEFTIQKYNNILVIKNSSGTTIGTGSKIEFKKNDTIQRYLEIKGIDGLAYSKYPDNLIIKRDSSLTYIYVINSTNIETYVNGVIPYEIGGSSPLEALKVQAVAARTYGITHIGKYASEGFDVRNDTYDQVYKGYSSTYNSSANNVYKAVLGTKGMVLKYGSSLVSGLFYSSNGGYTADSQYVWGYAYPYYKFQKDTYDVLHDSSYSTVYSRTDLANRLRNKGYNITNDFSLNITKSLYGYVINNQLTDESGHSYIISNDKNRTVFGLRSQRFTVSSNGGFYVEGIGKTVPASNIYIENASGQVVQANPSSVYVESTSQTVLPTEEKFTFSGSGYGHGVGMSQYGAINRANAGQTYTQILSFYYSGCTISSNYGN